MSDRQDPFSRRWQPAVAALLLVAGTLMGVVQTRHRPTPAAAQGREPELILQPESRERMSRKRQQNLLKHNFDKMKEDVETLATLAKSLQDELAKSNENILSLQVVEKAEKIEKLAKRIKNTARGY